MRLNQSVRKCIIEELIERRFGERWSKLKKARATFGMSIYRALWTSKERRRMSELPSGWLATTNAVSAALDSCGRKHFVDYFDIGENIPIPHSRERNILMVVDKQNFKLVERWEELIAEKERLQAEQVAARQEAQKILSSVMTTKKLKEHWPEISDVIDKIAPETATTALVAPVKKANELFGLIAKT